MLNNYCVYKKGGVAFDKHENNVCRNASGRVTGLPGGGVRRGLLTFDIYCSKPLAVVLKL